MAAMQRRFSHGVAGSLPVLTDQKREAAALLTETNLPIGKVAEQVGVDRNTIWRWRTEPTFAAHLAELTAELDKDAIRYAVARRRDRLAALERRQERLLQIVEERAAWFAEHEPNVPGGQTGMLLKTLKVVGSGPSAVALPEYTPDVALSKELREIEKQAAIEVGQWTEKREVDTLATVQQVTVTERQILRLPPRDRSGLNGTHQPIEANFTEVEPLTGLDRGKAKALRDRATAEARPATPATRLERLLERLAREDGLRPTPLEHQEARDENPALYDEWLRKYRLINDPAKRPTTDR